MVIPWIENIMKYGLVGEQITIGLISIVIGSIKCIQRVRPVYIIFNIGYLIFKVISTKWVHLPLSFLNLQNQMPKSHLL
ncbi:hypothetical protein D3C87_1739340 [compost metagenome]